MKHHETEGLLSPLIRQVRLKQAAGLVPANSVVLDLACGAGFLREVLPPGCRYFGVDRLSPPSLQRFDAFLSADLAAPNIFEELNRWLPERPDVVTLLAFIEHVKAPATILRSLRRLLGSNSKVILTTPHPVGRRIHDSLARLYLCSRSGAAEHEKFLDRRDLETIATEGGYTLKRYGRFLFGLNQVAELRPLSIST